MVVLYKGQSCFVMLLYYLITGNPAQTAFEKDFYDGF